MLLSRWGSWHLPILEPAAALFWLWPVLRLRQDVCFLQPVRAGPVRSGDNNAGVHPRQPVFGGQALRANLLPVMPADSGKAFLDQAGLRLRSLRGLPA